MKVTTFIAHLIRHIPDKAFPMVRYSGLFANRWKKRYLAQARKALKRWRKKQNLPASSKPKKPAASLIWAERQALYTGADPLVCAECGRPMIFVGLLFGCWSHIQQWFQKGGRDPTIPSPLQKVAA